MTTDVTITPALRFQIHDLYAAYAACLDEARYDEWPDFFTSDAWYRVVPRENFDRGLPLSTLSLKGTAMMRDRIYGVESTIFHAPYHQRHIISLPKVSPVYNGSIDVEANYSVIRTKRDASSELLSVGRYLDKLVFSGGLLKFSEKFCIFDNDIILNSLIYPI